VVGVEQWAVIPWRRFVLGLSIKEIARRTGRDRNTLRRALRASRAPRYRRPAEGSKLDPLKEEIHGLLGENPRLSGQRIRKLVAPLGYGLAGYAGSHTITTSSSNGTNLAHYSIPETGAYKADGAASSPGAKLLANDGLNRHAYRSRTTTRPPWSTEYQTTTLSITKSSRSLDVPPVPERDSMWRRLSVGFRTPPPININCPAHESSPAVLGSPPATVWPFTVSTFLSLLMWRAWKVNIASSSTSMRGQSNWKSAFCLEKMPGKNSSSSPKWCLTRMTTDRASRFGS
jgi:hypothetical protein